MAETAVQEAEPQTASEEPPTPDDLKKMEGIGPKVESILNEAGILIYRQLAEATVEDLHKIVVEDGGLNLAHPGTWPEQAELAAKGDWEGLETFQNDLVGANAFNYLDTCACLMDVVI